MSTIEKILEKLKTKPNDLTYDELCRILNYYGFEENNKGKTSGSRVRFLRAGDNCSILLHKPHDNVMKKYQINQIISVLKELGDLK